MVEANGQLDGESLRAEVSAVEWYATVELRPGILTPGWFDLRTIAPSLPWPSLAGKRCLDVGTFDGFWALEMQSRGAADVQAIDILDSSRWDWPRASTPEARARLEERKRAGDGFLTVMRELGRDIPRTELSIYDLRPETFGPFDVIYLGSILLHLRDPVLALERVYDALAPGGYVLSVDAIDLELTIRHPRRAVASFTGHGTPWWWKVNRVGHRALLESAGFVIEGAPRTLFMPPGPGQPTAVPKLARLRTPEAREAAITHWRGDPHSCVVGRRR